MQAYSSFVNALVEEAERGEVPYFEFDHAEKDPVPATHPIHPSNRIIVIEGLYCLLDEDVWRDTAAKMDIRIWVEVDREEVRQRLIERNFAAGLAPTRDLLVKRGESRASQNYRSPPLTGQQSMRQTCAMGRRSGRNGSRPQTLSSPVSLSNAYGALSFLGFAVFRLGERRPVVLCRHIQ